MIDVVHGDAVLFGGRNCQSLEVEIRSAVDRNQVKIAARHAECRISRRICKRIDVESAAHLVIIPFARLVQRLVGVVDLHRLLTGGAAVIGSVRCRHDAGFPVERTVEVALRPAVADVAGIEPVGFLIAPAQNPLIRQLEFGIAGAGIGIDRLDVHPILGRVGVRVARQAHVLSVQREKRRFQAEVQR